ncbi:hypothetical protein PM038_00065 [Halorubrum ezzemoulense]|uniref:hypothetical protein n=1 Tax=Halorubrum ezzemoulense TaxID=337243 RepID=UPI00232E23AB|nr:hypothetical protein [Halorubrum ezzemoulense]MDB2283669.1 hypothetical protein [Halorubrum ezzemoulense]
MPLYNRAVLEISAFDRTGVFELREHEPNRELTHDYLVGGRGQMISELYAQASDLDPTDVLPDADPPRRAGYFVDAGGGRNQFTISATVGVGDDDLQWGDGSSAAGDVTQYDASGDVNPVAKRDVLFRWLAEARSDSGGQVQLYTGEWSDGTHADTAGVFGRPKPVALLSVRAEKPKDDSAVVPYTFEFEEVAPVPDIDELTEDFTQAAENAINELGDEVPDY